MHGIDCCRDCNERYEACHDYCEKYLDAAGKWEKQKKQIKSARINEYDEYKCEAIRKAKRRSNHGKN